MATNFTEWATAVGFAPTVGTWVPEEERERLGAYGLYEMMYWSIPDAFRLAVRGSDSNPIYLPSAKVIVETLHRYVAPAMTVVADATLTEASDGDILNANAILAALFRRERFYSKFGASKRYGIMRGDWFLHVTADDTREAGSRISLNFVDPASVFPIHNEDNVDEVIGYHIVDQVEVGGRAYVKRLTYRKTTETGGPSPIEVSQALYETDKWGAQGMKQGPVIEQIINPTILPTDITSLPLYHIRNFEQEGTIWGSSELRGYERLLSGLNQAVSDEDLALALEALGVYTTSAPTPVDDAGNETGWDLGPGRVVEHPVDTTFNRIPGITNVTPYQDHMDRLEAWIFRGQGISDVAVGRVDVDVAESGIALALELAPILTRAEEKDVLVTDALTQFLWDIRDWIAAYERENVLDVIWVPTYGDKVPVNRKQRFDEVMQLVDRKLVSGEWARTELRKLGFEFPDENAITEQILQETEALATVEADAMGSRLDREIAAQDGSDTVSEAA